MGPLSCPLLASRNAATLQMICGSNRVGPSAEITTHLEMESQHFFYHCYYVGEE